MTFFRHRNTIMKVDVDLGQFARVLNSSHFYSNLNHFPVRCDEEFLFIFSILIL